MLKFFSTLSKMDPRKLILISSSTVDGYGWLEYVAEDVKWFFNKFNVKTIAFVPYALDDHEDYFQKVKEVFTKWGFNVTSVHHNLDNIKTADGIYIGGGNTFLLLKSLYDNNLVDVIRKRVLVEGIPYMGISAGTNVATRSINTTNDMPIVYPPSFDALKLVPFNINPHYMDTDKSDTKHKGETREERITQFLPFSKAPVLGMREGAHLIIMDGKATLKGIAGVRLFEKDKTPVEYPVGTDFTFLFN